MIWGYVYIALIVGITLVVFWIGDRECRLAITTLLTGSALTLAALLFTGSYFERIDWLMLAIDLAVLVAFLARALVSRRYWPMLLPMFQTITCATHLTKLAAPEIVPDAYSAAQGHWSYWQMAIILIAAFYARAEKTTHERT
ncbi:hypothetical protein [Sphingopyxis sp. JAI128]|uniref:hypothetical protein n=1 Tax=Sphingopyxis sp. JAI128 TaxID=2723066 RepID=UPI00160CAB39|nr:hypothetical protein [Sphingopyxis sp. JAI128]MBB6427915.1 glucose-6-phosphate-specific signal transduction histidine kinase [Sphingopyxis sp. JAI128]